MKTKSLIVVSVLGLLLAGAGFYRYWALVELAVIFLGTYGTPVGNSLRVDLWISFGAGCVGVALMLGAGVAYVVRRKRSLKPTEGEPARSGNKRPGAGDGNGV